MTCDMHSFHSSRCLPQSTILLLLYSLLYCAASWSLSRLCETGERGQGDWLTDWQLLCTAYRIVSYFSLRFHFSIHRLFLRFLWRIIHFLEGHFILHVTLPVIKLISFCSREVSDSNMMMRRKERRNGHLSLKRGNIQSVRSPPILFYFEEKTIFHF